MFRLIKTTHLRPIKPSHRPLKTSSHKQQQNNDQNKSDSSSFNPESLATGVLGVGVIAAYAVKNVWKDKHDQHEQEIFDKEMTKIFGSNVVDNLDPKIEASQGVDGTVSISQAPVEEEEEVVEVATPVVSEPVAVEPVAVEPLAESQNLESIKEDVDAIKSAVETAKEIVEEVSEIIDEAKEVVEEVKETVEKTEELAESIKEVAVEVVEDVKEVVEETVEVVKETVEKVEEVVEEVVEAVTGGDAAVEAPVATPEEPHQVEEETKPALKISIETVQETPSEAPVQESETEPASDPIVPQQTEEVTKVPAEESQPQVEAQPIKEAEPVEQVEKTDPVEEPPSPTLDQSESEPATPFEGKTAFDQAVEEADDEDKKIEIDPLKLPEFAQYVLIGGGAASFAAVRSITARDPGCKILILTDEAYFFGVAKKDQNFVSQNVFKLTAG